MKNIILSLLASLPMMTLAAENPKPAATVKIDGVEFRIVVQAPHLMIAPLQTFGAFEFQPKGDGFSGANLEMDEGFKGAIQELRKKNQFGKLGENLILTPPSGSGIGGQKILLIGLGNPNTFRSADMEQVGALGVREACRLGLTEFSHASDVQDGGVTRESAGVVGEHVLKGMIAELRVQKALAGKGLLPACQITTISLLAGPKYVKDTIATLNKISK